jgi:GT2 family glycosyltransferase
MTQVTIIISPRDRYSGVDDCIKNLYTTTNPDLFELIVLDLGYPRSIIETVQKQLLGYKNTTQIISLGRITPMEAFRAIREKITTPYVALIDNDTRTTSNWLPPLITAAEETNAAIISPLTLEKEGVDKGAELRSHVYTTEVHYVDVNNQQLLIEHKSYRRALPEDIPKVRADTEAFELHAVFMRTTIFQSIELPRMTIREHIDIGMQLWARGEKLICEPKSVVHFDNLGTRAHWYDIFYFRFRWAPQLTESSSRLFEKRWGYRFYSEQAIYNWVRRRTIFLVLRWLYLPVNMCNNFTVAINKLFLLVKPIHEPLENPDNDSKSLLKSEHAKNLKQLSHDVN